MLPDDPDDFSQHEGDFLNIDSTHRAHKQEIVAERERIRHRTVQAKYFKTPQLNFLTWSEKEQMRNLHRTDPEEWCAEKLADCFPVDGATAAKIVRARWTPSDATKIRKHDAAVQRAWQGLADGKTDDIEPKLLEHLRKYSDRSLKHNVFRSRVSSVAQPINQTVPKEDFLKIITSCKKYQKPHQAPLVADESKYLSEFPATTNNEDTFLLGKVERAKPVMFRELDVVAGDPAQSKRIETGSQRNTQHNPFVNPREELANGDSEPERLPTLTAHDYVPKYEVASVQPSEAEFRKLTMIAIKDHIRIPKHVWKKGGTYKLNDCYYDDDGEFLYRVPGMTGEQ